MHKKEKHQLGPGEPRSFKKTKKLTSVYWNLIIIYSFTVHSLLCICYTYILHEDLWILTFFFQLGQILKIFMNISPLVFPLAKMDIEVADFDFKMWQVRVAQEVRKDLGEPSRLHADG